MYSISKSRMPFSSNIYFIDSAELRLSNASWLHWYSQVPPPIQINDHDSSLSGGGRGHCNLLASAKNIYIKTIRVHFFTKSPGPMQWTAACLLKIVASLNHPLCSKTTEKPSLHRVLFYHEMLLRALTLKEGASLGNHCGTAWAGSWMWHLMASCE